MKVIGRKKYLRKLKNYATTEPENKAFFGVKGLGKSTIMEEVFSKINCSSYAEEYKYLYVRMILNPGKKGEDLVNFLLDKVINAIDLIDDDDLREKLQQKIKDDSEKFHSKDSVLTEALQTIKDYEYFVILIMDEFHNMGRNSDVGSEQYDFLRSLNESGLIYYWIISDSDFSDVYATEQFTTSFFAQKFLPETMPQIQEEDMLELITTKAEKYDIELNGDANMIYQLIGGIPGFVDSALRCYESLEGIQVDEEALIDAMLDYPKIQSLLTVWSRSLTAEQKDLLVELSQCDKIYQKEYQDRGMIGKINQLGDNSGLGLLIHSIDENGTYWQINSMLYREFVIRKFDLFDGAVIKSVSEAKTETQLQNTYIQNNYYTVNNNFFNPDNALEALMDLKRLAVNQATIALPDSRLMKSAVQQLPFQQRGWDALDDNQKEEQATAYANRIFDSGDFKADTLSETQMRRFFLTQGILDNLTDISRGNLISAIQVYDLLQFCVDKFGLNMLNSESARGILFAKLYEAILKESLKPALASVDEIAGMKLKFNMNTEYLLSDAPADIMTMGNFEFILRKSFCRQALANVCTFNLGREEKDVQWWYNHHSDIDAITHLRNDCCHSGNHFGPDKLDELIKLLFEMGVIANVELYNDIAGRIIL